MTNVKRKVTIGSQYDSITSGMFTVVERVYLKKNYSGWYRVRFSITGTEVISNGSNILKGKVKDNFLPRICGVGYVGNIDKPSSHILYNIWQNMLKRCYEDTHKNFDEYGGSGVVVCDRWHNFSNYVDDVTNKENYKLLEKDKKNWNVDKDKICIELGISSRVYSNETTVIISAKENNDMREREYKQPYEKNRKGSTL